jgi:hypothetical protein
VSCDKFLNALTYIDKILRTHSQIVFSIFGIFKKKLASSRKSLEALKVGFCGNKLLKFCVSTLIFSHARVLHVEKCNMCGISECAEGIYM